LSEKVNVCLTARHKLFEQLL